MIKLKKLLILAVLVNFVITISPAWAQIPAINGDVDPDFNPNMIITDEELTNANTMSHEDIAAFLKNKSSSLANYEIIDPATGLNKTATEIIFQASQNYQINPRVLLVLLQKEQSLVENSTPTQYNFDWATGYARCDACDQNDPAIVKFKGLAKQIDSAAASFRYFLDNPPEVWLKKPGLLYSIDSIPVIPANRATALLYTYTPHFRGNYNFWKIWQRWFGKVQIFPDGVIVRARDDSQIWLIKNGRRHPLSAAAFNSRWKSNEVLATITDLLEQYEIGAKIKYPDFSLLKNPVGEIYLLSGNARRLIDKTAFHYFGFDPDEVVKANDEELAVYTIDEPIVKDKKFPLGVLTQNSKTKELFFVENSVKHAILDKKIAQINFPNKKTRLTTTAELKKYSDGEPIKFNDGALIKENEAPEVYLISNNERRPIADEATFNALGLSWGNIITVSAKALELHILGSPIAIAPLAEPLAKN
ncbi:MAG TPA: hypothetical protein DEB73_02810 [Candidatus Magasanikbacteria bacterium]|nr:hypothetical protein [Candidatus Magasanikbacteria bacterium]